MMLRRKLQKIVIFADIDSVVSTGHFWRAARLACALKARQQDLILEVMVPNNDVARRAVESFRGQRAEHREVNFKYVNIGPYSVASHETGEPESPPPFSYLSQHCKRLFPEGDLIIVDSYRVGPAALGALRRRARKVVVVDDYGHIPDLSSDHAHAVITSYQRAAKEVGLEVLGPLQHHFLPAELFPTDIKAGTRDDATIVVIFGGTDDGKYSWPLLESMHQHNASLFERFKFKIVLTHPSPCAMPTALNAANIEIITRYKPQELFPRASAAICAGGQTPREMRAARLSFIGMVELNRTQRLVCEDAARHGVPTVDLTGQSGRDLEDVLGVFGQICAARMHKGDFVTLPELEPCGMDNLVTALLPGP